MLPFIDLINHSSEARPPMLQLDDDDQLVMTVAHLSGNQLASAAAGDELYISYGSDSGAVGAAVRQLSVGLAGPVG
jgi:hypothetical protein